MAASIAARPTTMLAARQLPTAHVASSHPTFRRVAWIDKTIRINVNVIYIHTACGLLQWVFFSLSSGSFGGSQSGCSFS